MIKSLVNMVKGGSKPPPKEPVASAHRQLGVEYESFQLKPNAVVRTEWFNRLVFPSSEGLDKYEMLRYQSSIIKFIEWFEKHKSFDICGLNDIMEASKIKVDSSVKAIHDTLRNLHCIKFKNIPPEILEEMPMMINAVFAGRPPRDITAKEEEITDVIRIK